jgi:PPK2 family polyphosphate:nucleotide phosphotransferase
MNNSPLDKIKPDSHPLCTNKEEALELTQKLQQRMYELLYLMFAHSKYSLLIVLHGIDTAGKDGTVRHIFSGANPQGIKVHSFKKPTALENRHDFLWRCHLHTPESGLTSIFNRSYYEEVTTVRVHPEHLSDQHIPKELLRRKDFFHRRFERINEFEKLLTERGTKLVKIFLHISNQEQKLRIKDRLQDRTKNWKYSAEDIQERKHWQKYMKVFGEMIVATNTKHAPWTIVPADSKWYRNLVVSKTIVDELEKMKMHFPKAKLDSTARKFKK